jgi:mRNA-degrading endonuclease RelE of RelBE toxin-antitoxin system
MNADPLVMEHMQGLMSRERSDDFIDRIEAHWAQHGWGLWAVEVPGVAPFVGYVGLWPADYVADGMVEVGWRLTTRRHPPRRCASTISRGARTRTRSSAGWWPRATSATTIGSPMSGWRVDLTPAAMRQLRRLRGDDLVAIRGAILALGGADPYPSGARKLVAVDLWQIRLRIHGAPWRIVYQVREAQQLVVVTRVARRDEATYHGI